MHMEKRIKTVQLKNAFSNSSVFSRLLKVPSEIDCLENNVKLFQTDGAAWLKPRIADDVFLRGMFKSNWFSDRSVLTGWYSSSIERKYAGWFVMRVLYVIIAIL